MDENLRLRDADGAYLARDNVVIAFFGKCPFADVVKGAKYCVDRFLDIVPGAALKWSVMGMNSGSFKPLTDKSLARCRAMLTVATAKQKDVHFRLLGPEKFGPDYGLYVNGYKSPSEEGFLDQTNTIELRFPREFIRETGDDAFVALVTDLFEKLPCDSGYASAAICFGRESQWDKASTFLVPAALRSHGFDIPNNLSTGNSLGKLCRGARWLTILSNELLGQVGGIDSLKKQLADGVEIIECSHGVLLRAGRTPEIGDVNRQQTTPLLASVAHAIEAVTFFGDSSLRPLFGDAERQERWERRFWPHE
ncbi:MAG: DUF3396 domain-containing protein [Pirellulaceae bacterium]|nr:DUF3396 domain-containing protein [Pirellulaceae bacterium]